MTTKIAPYTGELLTLPVGLLAIPCAEGDVLAGWAFRRVDDALDGLLQRLVQEEKFRGKEKEVLLLHTHQRIGPGRILLVGLGKGEVTALRLAAAVAARNAQGHEQQSLGFALPELDAAPLLQAARLVVEGALLGGYRFERYKKEKKQEALGELLLVLSSDPTRQVEGGRLQQALARGELLGRAVCFCRDLVNEPADRLAPGDLARVARELAGGEGMAVEVLSAAECAARGMGCLVGVGAGSEREAQLIHLCYRPPGEPAEPRRRIALIGKGITFDAGGLNMKTGKGMEGMKADMAGAAAVLAVMKILPLLRPAAEVHAVVPAAENMPSGRALRPGDILTALDGTTVEVRNTDAEGRLVLADAIAYAVQLGADEILELSTLTGSCLVALGPYHAGVMCDDEALVQRFLAAAQLAGEKAWRLPLVRELLKEVEGEISDLKNGSSNRYGGAIQGGLFLEVFARKKLFLHLDIAGPATAEKETPLTRKGGTGYGVLALAEYLAPEPDGAG